jgi:hypothetical protein
MKTFMGNLCEGLRDGANKHVASPEEVACVATDGFAAALAAAKEQGYNKCCDKGVPISLSVGVLGGIKKVCTFKNKKPSVSTEI